MRPRSFASRARRSGWRDTCASRTPPPTRISRKGWSALPRRSTACSDSEESNTTYADLRIRVREVRTPIRAVPVHEGRAEEALPEVPGEAAEAHWNRGRDDLQGLRVLHDGL